LYPHRVPIETPLDAKLDTLGPYILPIAPINDPR
jgi:hypothetical protein